MTSMAIVKLALWDAALFGSEVAALSISTLAGSLISTYMLHITLTFSETPTTVYFIFFSMGKNTPFDQVIQLFNFTVTGKKY